MKRITKKMIDGLSHIYKADSRSEEIRVWPDYDISNGGFMCYVRILRGKRYWLIPVRVLIDWNKIPTIMETLEQFNHQCYLTFHGYIISAEMFELQNSRNGRVLLACYDINQGPEIDRIKPI